MRTNAVSRAASGWCYGSARSPWGSSGRSLGRVVGVGRIPSLGAVSVISYMFVFRFTSFIAYGCFGLPLT